MDTCSKELRGLDFFYRFFFTFSAKGNNFCDFLFASLHTKPFLKRDQLLFTFRVEPLRKETEKNLMIPKGDECPRYCQFGFLWQNFK